MAPFEAFSDPPIEGVEGHTRMDQQATSPTGADQDMPLPAAMDAVARLQQRAAAGQAGVVAHLLLRPQRQHREACHLYGRGQRGGA